MDRKHKTRVALLSLGVLLAAGTIVARLYQLQIARSAELRERALRQHQTSVEIDGGRGAVLDREGRELAVSVETMSLYAHPQRFPDENAKRDLARDLAPVLGVSAASLRERLGSDRPFVWLRRRLDPETAAAVRELPLPEDVRAALGFEAEPRRLYPRGQLAVHVVGYANIDQKGVEGLEQRFDDVLRGGPSTYLAVRDGHGGMVLQLIRPSDKQPEDLVLTLDLVLQHLVERELTRAMRETGARAASAVMIEPATGQVLALANRPAADPNRFGKASPAARRNRAVVDLYEPGSTFKIVAAAAALDRGTVDPGRRFDCEQGSTLVAGHRIRDTGRYGVLTLREILERSSNVGILKVCRTLPAAQYHDYITRFGFGGRLGIELPGESAGLLRPVSRWTPLSQSSISFGQEIGVTVLQMGAAFATLANDGVLVPPRLVLGRRDAAGRFHRYAPPEPRRVVSARTARTLTGILEGVVANGTGSAGQVAGYRAAGKTGTAQKALPSGGYSPDDYVASFGGFAPVRAPRFALIVVLDSPRGDRHQGGHVAAPVFGRIATEALAHLRAPRDDDPLPGRPKLSPAPVPTEAALLAGERVRTSAGEVPDLRGLSLREAVTELANRGYRSRVQGGGLVIGQSPAPGTDLAAGETCTIRLAWPEAGARVAALGSPAR